MYLLLTVALGSVKTIIMNFESSRQIQPVGGATNSSLYSCKIMNLGSNSVPFKKIYPHYADGYHVKNIEEYSIWHIKIASRRELHYRFNCKIASPICNLICSISYVTSELQCCRQCKLRTEDLPYSVKLFRWELVPLLVNPQQSLTFPCIQ